MDSKGKVWYKIEKCGSGEDGAPGLEIWMQVDWNAFEWKGISDYLEVEMALFNGFLEPKKRDAEKYRLCPFAKKDGTPDDVNEHEKEIEFYGSEEDMLFMTLYRTINQRPDDRYRVYDYEISYKGSRYTHFVNAFGEASVLLPARRVDIEQLDEHISLSFRLSAMKDGKKEKVELFFFSPVLFDIQEGMHCISPAYYPVSHGIVELKTGMRYAGLYPTMLYGQHQGVEYVHMFFERQGEETAFKVLIDGELYQNMSMDGERIIFYNTIVNMKSEHEISLPYSRKQEINEYDMIFQKNAKGEYRYTVENQKMNESKFSGTRPYFPPQMSGPLSQESLDSLYGEYVRALYSVFYGAEEYRTGKYIFRHMEGTENRFDAEGEEFRLEAKFDFQPVTGIDSMLFGYYTWLEHDDSVNRYFEIERAVIDLPDHRSIFLKPMGGSELEIEIHAGEGDTSLSGKFKFSELNKVGFFFGTGLPRTIEFDKRLPSFEQNIEIYRTIVRKIEKNVEHFVEVLRQINGTRVERKQETDPEINTEVGQETNSGLVFRMNREEMRDGLYRENGMIVDENLVSFAMELQRNFERHGQIPNILLLGEPGSGKSSAADRIARTVFKKDGALELVPGSLKGMWVGHTKKQVFDTVRQAEKENKVVFIDEAYVLTSDCYGQEALTILLKLMEGKRPEDETHERGAGDTIDIKWSTIKDIPPIWMAGYECETRLMMQSNQGLFRRLKTVVLASPTTEQLYEELMKRLEDALKQLSEGKDSELLDHVADMSGEARGEWERRFKILQKQFEDNGETIKTFFRWGAQLQNSKYFAHHAGVINFLNSCIDRIEFNLPEEEIARQMEGIIDRAKREVKSQIETARRGKGGIGISESVQMVFENKTRFADLVGCESQITYLKSLIDMIVDKTIYAQANVTVPKGALLLGSPGVGKTMIARAMAGELQERFRESDPDKRVGFMSLSAPELTAKDVNFISGVFDEAEKYDMCVIFIDEVDAIAKRRSQNAYYSHLIELIKQMDGMEQRSNIFILAATNAGESLDPAFTRSGRIDKKLEFFLPEQDARRELAKRNIMQRKDAVVNFQPEDEEGVSILADRVAAITSGCTPGDIENIVNTAFILYRQERKGKEAFSGELNFGKAGDGQPDADSGLSDELKRLGRQLEEAYEMHMIGDPRPAGKKEEKEIFQSKKNDVSRSSTAIHEVGHALAGKLCGASIEKITSLPRGGALGYVRREPKKPVTKTDFENQILIVMGGRAAEEIVYGKDNVSVGASRDMVSATHLARQMVESLGFSDEFGFMTLVEDTARHLGESQYSCSESTREKSDLEVNKLLKELYGKAVAMLADKKELLLKLAEEVFRNKTMTGTEFEKAYQATCEKLKQQGE